MYRKNTTESWENRTLNLHVTSLRLTWLDHRGNFTRAGGYIWGYRGVHATTSEDKASNKWAMTSGCKAKLLWVRRGIQADPEAYFFPVFLGCRNSPRSHAININPKRWYRNHRNWMQSVKIHELCDPFLLKTRTGVEKNTLLAIPSRRLCTITRGKLSINIDRDRVLSLAADARYYRKFLCNVSRISAEYR